ncbi:MAG: thiol:disulfide interchange protein DsbC [Gammaproteobacteria bacterium]|jgi:thiol:disulfide interchange protein DsbC
MRLLLIAVFVLFFQTAALRAELSSEEVIRTSINRTFPDVDITSIKKSQLNDIYEVLLGPDLIYASGDGRYIFQGDLIDLKQKRNLSEEQRSHTREALLAGISPKEYIEFAPVKRKHTVYVFTDIDCGYCRRLHEDMAELNNRGIAVRYLAFPRSGIGSKTHKQMESVWCAVDRNKAMNEAKQGMRVSEKTCDNPVSRQYALGQDMGVRGTPAIYTEHGKSLPGYMPPDRLLQALTQ